MALKHRFAQFSHHSVDLRTLKSILSTGGMCWTGSAILSSTAAVFCFSKTDRFTDINVSLFWMCTWFSNDSRNNAESKMNPDQRKGGFYLRFNAYFCGVQLPLQGSKHKKQCVMDDRSAYLECNQCPELAWLGPIDICCWPIRSTWQCLIASLGAVFSCEQRKSSSIRTATFQLQTRKLRTASFFPSKHQERMTTCTGFCTRKVDGSTTLQFLSQKHKDQFMKAALVCFLNSKSEPFL